MRVTLRDGSKTRSFPFVEPSRDKWSKQNHEFLVGVPTGLPAPFDKVFVKRVNGARVVGHNLLMRVSARPLPASPKCLGYAEAQKGKHLYFFENLEFKTLESELNKVDVVCAEIVMAVVRSASDLFQAIASAGHVYIDFCAKNIMLDRKSKRIFFIDVDSSWPAGRLRIRKPKAAEGEIAFRGRLEPSKFWTL